MNTRLSAKAVVLGLLTQVILAGTATAAGLTVSPATVTNDFTGRLTLTLSNLPSPGRTVIVERYADFDNDGVADSDEPIIQGFRVTDGQVPTIGGVRNLNMPGDEDGAVNAQLQVKLYFPGSDATVDRIAGNFVFKVSDATPGGFAPVTQRFSIQQKTRTQGVHGRVTAASTGLPLTNAFVILLVPDGPGGVGSFADGNGEFTIHSMPGDYLVAAIRPGFIVDPNTALVTIHTNQFATKDVALSNGTYTVSGRVADADSGEGLRGVFVFADGPLDQSAVATTDGDGNYRFDLTPGEWEIRPNQNQAAQQGYVALGEQGSTHVDGAASDLNFALPKATALIYGRLADDANRPVWGVGMRAGDASDHYESSGRTFPTNADYALAVVAGTWYLEPERDEPALQGFFIQGTNVTVSDGLAVRVDFVARRPTTRLAGRLVHEQGAPVDGVEVNFCPQGQGGCFSVFTDAAGAFSMSVAAGEWDVGASSEDLAPLGLLAQRLAVTVVEGVDQTNLLVVARATTAQIQVSVQHTNGSPLGGVPVSGYARISNATYSVYGMTDGNGLVSLGAIDGQWELNLSCTDLNQRGFECVSQRVIAVSGANVMVDFRLVPLPAPQILQFSASSSTVDEAGSNAVITVVRTGPTNGTVTVDYATGGGSASAGSDYEHVTGTLTFEPGVAERTFAVRILDDALPELSETIGLVLGNLGSGANLGTPSAATVTITDNDSLPGPNVTWYAVAKGQGYRQDGSGAPTTNGLSEPFEFVALVNELFAGALTSVTFQAPGGANHILFPNDEEELEFEFGQAFPSKAALDAAFPAGNYVFHLVTFADGTRTPTLNLGPEAYPPVPRIANWTAAQSVEANTAFTLTWDAFGGGSADDFVQLTIRNESGNAVFQTPDVTGPGALNGTHTSQAIPGAALDPNEVYQGQLLFVKRRGLDTNSYPMVPGLTAYFRRTEFSLRTVPPPPTQGKFQFDSAAYTVGEAAGTAQFHVRRVGGSQGQVRVTAAITGGTGTPAVDYGALPGGDPFAVVLTFAEGETNATVSFPVTNDTAFDPDETVLLTLRNPTDGAVLGSPSNAVMRILDNDPRPDPIRPTVNITSPLNGTKVTNASFVLQGTARDNFAVVMVECQLENSGGTTEFEPVTSATGWTNWAITVTGLRPGTNHVRVRSWDDAGNPSTVSSRMVIYLVSSALTLTTTGTGSILPAWNARLLPVGLGQTLTAVPGAGYVFSNWSGGLSSTSARLTFLMQSNLALQANFVTNPFGRTRGSYNGLFHDTTNGVRSDRSGFFTFNLTDRGRYTGVLQVGGRRHSFLGQFDLYGNSASTIRRSGTNALRLELNLAPLGSPNDVTGRLISTNTSWIAGLIGDRAPTFTATNPSPYRGRYTLTIPWDAPAAGSGGGDGYGFVVVAPSGRLTFGGTLADGTPVTQGVPLSKDGLWPWYAALYGGKGSLLSWATLNTNVAPGLALEGTLHWIKPALPTARYYPNGFASQVQIQGSAYVAPGTNAVLQLNPSGQVTFNGGNLVGPFMNVVLLGPNNRILNLTSNQPLALTISLPTGLFRGAVTVTNNGLRVTRSFQGAVLPGRNYGAGFFLGTNQSGRVYLGPTVQ